MSLPIKNVGFIGLGNVGGKLAGSLIRSDFTLWVHDLNENLTDQFKKQGAKICSNAGEIAQNCEMIITCLPSPEASASVVEGDNGIISGIKAGAIWAEMSTTDEKEVLRLATLIGAKNASSVDCPVSGGCHRAATGNIAIFAGCERAIFEKIFPVLSIMGSQILHTGPLGSASILKVVTNYLATANLVSIAEALSCVKALNLDLSTAYEAIRISSGNSFVHETESQVILNGSRNINFTMDLVLKDITLFLDASKRAGMDLELAPLLAKVFKDGIERYGLREWSPNIIKRLEDDYNLDVRALGFPSEMTDDKPKESGFEVKTSRS